MSNAVEFISAYNTVDARLRAMYRGKGNLSFADLVRRCAEFNATVRKYEEELMSFARLRNAIVHESTRERIIAEPCDQATRLFSRIAELLTSPPLLSSLKQQNVISLDSRDPVSEAVRRMSRSAFSNLPVYSGKRMAGLLNYRRLVRELGETLERGEDVGEFFARPCGELLREEDMQRFYRVLSVKDTVQSAVDAFSENRKLLAVIVTPSGSAGDGIVNLVTLSDLPRLMQMLEE